MKSDFENELMLKSELFQSWFLDAVEFSLLEKEIIDFDDCTLIEYLKWLELKEKKE